MANKTRTTRIKGNTEYAKVADRLNEFRKANPRSKISVKHYHDEEGNLTSRAYIWKDKVDFYGLLKSGVSSKEALESADSEGTSFMKASQLAKEKGALYGELLITNYDPRPFMNLQMNLFGAGTGAKWQPVLINIPRHVLKTL